MASPSLRLSAGNVAALESGAARVVVIGPSGWLGRAATAMLDHAFTSGDLRDRVTLFGSHARVIPMPSGALLACHAIADLPRTDLANCIVLHFAYLTKDKARSMSAEAYVAANDAIQDAVLLALERTPPKGLFFASSGAVYHGAIPGFPTLAENPYGWLKARHEQQLEIAAERTGMTLINGRIFTLAGEYINKTHLYALATFLCDLRAGKPIYIKSPHPVWRSYAYVGDVINLAIALMLGPPQAPLCFDMAGDQAIEIGQLAELCVEIAGRPGTAIHRPAMSDDDAVGDRMIGDCETFQALMTREAIAPLPLAAQISITASYLAAEGTSER